MEKPKYVYKYCSSSRANQILNDLYLYLTPLEYLNDIYEFAYNALFIESDKSVDKYFIKNIIAHSGLEYKEALEIASNVNFKEKEDSYKIWKSNILAILKSIRSNSGVTCFSEEMNNQRMWGTYGDSHKGVCIEFRSNSHDSKIQQNLVPVIYKKNKLNLCISELMKSDGSLNNEVVLYLSSIKHTHWRDEKEWRILMLADKHQSKEERYFKITKSDISRVFLGPLISKEDEESVYDIISKNNLGIGVFKRKIDGMLGTESLEGFEISKSFNDIIYWAERAKRNES